MKEVLFESSLNVQVFSHVGTFPGLDLFLTTKMKCLVLTYGAPRIKEAEGFTTYTGVCNKNKGTLITCLFIVVFS